MTPLSAAFLVLFLSALAEGLHARRVFIAARLAFGPEGKPHRWTWVAPFLRCLALAVFAWGLAVMWQLRQASKDGEQAIAKAPIRLVFVADLSPSMYLKDAGPGGKQTRQERMREEVETVLMRVGGDIRYTVVGFYTEAHTIVRDARDPELVRNVFNGLPVQYVMKPGSTDLGVAINASVKLVEGLPAQSVRIILFTDGDTVPLQSILSRPNSVKEVLVLGVGNSHKGTFIAGHQSRQDPEVLASVARALRGSYYDVNEKHVSTEALGDLVVRAPLPKSGFDLSQLAVFAMLLGATVLSLLPVALQYFGSSWKVVSASVEEGEGAVR